MSISSAGGNKQLTCIAYATPGSSLNDDFGPYKAPTGFSKFKFSTSGAGTGYSFTVYDGSDQPITDFLNGTYRPQFSSYYGMNPPPAVPNAAYGSAAVVAGCTPDMWSKVVGTPPIQGGTGTEANPLVTTGTSSQILIASYPIWYVKVVLTAFAGAAGIVKVLIQGIP